MASIKSVMTYVAVSLLFSFFTFYFGALHASEMETPKISVTGSAVTLVDPDITSWNVSIRSEGKTAEAVTQLHTQRLKKLLDFLKNKGIKKDKIKTQRMSLSEDWHYVNNKRKKEGYVAHGSVNFPSDIDSYLALWAGLSSVDGININSTHFTLQNPLPVQKTTRIEALKVAKTKAKTMVEALNAHLGKPLLIEDLSHSDDVRIAAPQSRSLKSQSRMMADSMSLDSNDVVSPGKLEIRMRVKVVFEIE